MFLKENGTGIKQFRQNSLESKGLSQEFGPPIGFASAETLCRFCLLLTKSIAGVYSVPAPRNSSF